MGHFQSEELYQKFIKFWSSFVHGGQFSLRTLKLNASLVLSQTSFLGPNFFFSKIWGANFFGQNDSLGQRIFGRKNFFDCSEIFRWEKVLV